MHVQRNDVCALGQRERARVGLVVLISTRGRRPRVQTCSRTWHVCDHCLSSTAEHMDKNQHLLAALAEFAAKVPKPRPMSPTLAALYRDIAEKGC